MNRRVGGIIALGIAASVVIDLSVRHLLRAVVMLTAIVAGATVGPMPGHRRNDADAITADDPASGPSHERAERS